MKIFPKILAEIILILINTHQNSCFFENVSVSYHIKEIPTFKKLANTKRTAWFEHLMWVLFPRHTLERVFECSVGDLSLSMFIS
jgi:hypothetical protein